MYRVFPQNDVYCLCSVFFAHCANERGCCHREKWITKDEVYHLVEIWSNIWSKSVDVEVKTLCAGFWRKIVKVEHSLFWPIINRFLVISHRFRNTCQFCMCVLLVWAQQGLKSALLHWNIFRIIYLWLNESNFPCETTISLRLSISLLEMPVHNPWQCIMLFGCFV